MEAQVMDVSASGTGKSEVVEALREAIHSLLVIKGRLPVLQAVAQELKRMQGGQDYRVRNDAVLRVVRDSYDMLVVDLASLREGVTGRRGLFKKLRRHRHDLRRFGPDDVDLRPIQYIGTPLSKTAEAEFIASERAWMAARWNEVFDRLFPDGASVTKAQVDDLMNRFRKDTEPTKNDRNRVRAHRYEEASNGSAAYFQTLGQVEAQIQVFERYFNDLFLVLAKGSYEMTPLVAANAEGTARDLADLILLGSINWAVIRYGLVPEKAAPGDLPPWYWHRRKEFYERGGLLNEEASARAATARTVPANRRSED
jgi:hypothetical protein